MLFVDESSWDEVVLAADLVDVFFEKHHIVEIVLDETLSLLLEGVNMLSNILLECPLCQLSLKIFTAI